MRGMTALELLCEQEGRDIPDIKMKKFSAKHEGMKLEDYSVAPKEDFWSRVKKNDWSTDEVTGCNINVDKL